MDDDERVELEADIEKIHHTLEADRSQWQFDDYDDSDEDSDDEDNLCIDLETQPSASVSVASVSARSGGIIIFFHVYIHVFSNKTAYELLGLESRKRSGASLLRSTIELACKKTRILKLFSQNKGNRINAFESSHNNTIYM